MAVSKNLKIANTYPIKEIIDIGPLTLEKKLSKDEFILLCSTYPNLQMEREKNGKIIIKSPVIFGTGKRELHIGYYLTHWWKENGEPGEVFGPSTGIELPDSSIKSPDCGWISAERLKQIPIEEENGEFLSVVPDFIIEIRSKTDNLAKLKRKMSNSWIKNGVRLAWLIDPYKEKAYIYREEQEIEEVKGFDGKSLSGEDLILR